MNTNININHQQKQKLFLLMFLLTIICLGIGCLRIHFAENTKGLFLAWNLFLAWIPFLTSYYISKKQTHISKLKIIPPLLLWLLFLPNAPYIITDLVHLHPRAGVPFWFDSSALFLFAFHGLLLGILSTLFIHEVLERHFTKFVSWIILLISFILCGFGVYLGRFQRWNSWDLLLNPIELIENSFLKLTSPQAILVTGIFSLLFLISYLIVYQLIHLKSTSYDSKIA